LIGNLPDEPVADLIRNDQIDILVDLANHTADNRLAIFARKPAPVQLTYLASAGGTAVDTIDYRLTDCFLDPQENADAGGMTKSFRLAGPYWCYQQSIPTEPVRDLPALSTGIVTFGCLNNFTKVSPVALDAWARLLAALPDSRLLLHIHRGTQRDRVMRFFADRHVAVDRIETIDRLPLPQYFATYHRIDIALDPFPYPGATTTCDALWMGVPVVTLAGKIPETRAGVSILSHLGLPDLVAQTPEHYVQIATDLAADRRRLAQLRSSLRDRLQSSPLMDAERFARDIEAAYRTMWQMWCRE
jgi:predicted O-linked N-acetylglucosamine transferase (SPINDLY family)